MMKIDGEEIVDRTEIWSVKQKSSDGEVREIACPEGESEARRLQAVFGGQLWRRAMYVTVGRPEEALSDEETLDLAY